MTVVWWRQYTSKLLRTSVGDVGEFGRHCAAYGSKQGRQTVAKLGQETWPRERCNRLRPIKYREMASTVHDERPGLPPDELTNHGVESPVGRGTCCQNLSECCSVVRLGNSRRHRQRKSVYLDFLTRVSTELGWRSWRNWQTWSFRLSCVWIRPILWLQLQQTITAYMSIYRSLYVNHTF